MKVRMDETRKETSFEKVLLVIIWVLYLCLFYSNTFTTAIRSGIKLGTKWASIMEMLKLMASAQKSFCFQFAVEIILLFVLIGLTVKEFRKTYIGTRMKQILKHETERDTAYDQLRMAFELLLMNAEDRMMPMDFYTPAARLIHLSSLRYSFRYPLKRKPEEYSAYGMNLKKSLRNVCIIIIVLLVLRYLTINNIFNLANL